MTPKSLQLQTSPTPCLCAARGDLEGLQRLFAEGADLNTNEWGNHDTEFWGTPLQQAAEHGQTQVCQWLVEQGVGVDDDFGYGSTALHQAMFGGHHETLKLLLQLGADVNAGDPGNYDRTPLYFAIQKKDRVAIHILLEAGGNPYREDSFHNIPWDTASPDLRHFIQLTLEQHPLRISIPDFPSSKPKRI